VSILLLKHAVRAWPRSAACACFTALLIVGCADTEPTGSGVPSKTMLSSQSGGEPAGQVATGSPKSPAPARSTPPKKAIPPVRPLDGVQVTRERLHYRVRGNTELQLRDSLTRQGLSDRGVPVDALTEWYVRWRFWYDYDRARCGIRKVTVHVTIKQTLPEWRTREAATTDLANRWADYQRSLRLHEDGHSNHAVAAGNGVFRALRGMPSLPACAELEKRANHDASAVVRSHRVRELAYDVETDHGATQGAVFP
jgi:predicted secreted Zn-dependent protease